MTNYRSAMGKTVDMSALVAKNENTRAVGNMNVNARGDTIDALGRVIQPVTEKVNKAYSDTVGKRVVQPQRPQSQPARTIAPDAIKPKVEAPKIEEAELTPEELELDRELDDDELVEQIKAMESKLPKAKK
jgi:hypothetical protein